MKYPGVAVARVLLAVALSLAAMPRSARAEEVLPAEALAKIKAATVFVRSVMYVPEVKAPLEFTGSGFVISAQGGQVLVATNSHVVTHELKESADIQLVFRSGTPDETTVPATIVARDPRHDLAILKAAPEGPSQPLELDPAHPLQETMSIYLVGFPRGKGLTFGEENPEVTVGRGSITSIRRDESGCVRRVQTDATATFGSSGGPLLDLKGHVIGIQVETVPGTQIHLCIPAANLWAMLAGRAANVTFQPKETRDAQRVYSVTADVMDPQHNLRNLAILLIQKDKLAAKPKVNKDGVWSRVAPEVLQAPLTISGRTATGTITLPAPGAEGTPYLVQVCYMQGHDAPTHEEPVEYQVAPVSDWLQLARCRTAARRWRCQAPALQPTVPARYVGRVREPNATVAPTTVGKAEAGGQALGGVPEVIGDATATPLKLDAPLLVPTLEWSPDGRSFYAVEQHSGVLRKISAPGLRVQRQIDLGGVCAAVARSAQGLLVAMESKDEVWVLDENSLEVKSRFHVKDLLTLTAAPAAEVGVALCGRPGDRWLSVLDLREGKVRKSYRMEALRSQAAAGPGSEAAARELESLDDLRMTPDGRHLFLISARVLHRFGVHGAALEYEEGGPDGSGREARIEISADSRYVALVNGGGNTSTPPGPSIGQYGTYVFRVEDLQMPVAALDQGAFPCCLAFDKATRRLYAQNLDSQLMVFKPSGEREREYCLTGPGDLTKQILPAPDGRGVLVLTQTELFWVAFKP